MIAHRNKIWKIPSKLCIDDREESIRIVDIIEIASMDHRLRALGFDQAQHIAIPCAISSIGNEGNLEVGFIGNGSTYGGGLGGAKSQRTEDYRKDENEK